MAAAAVLVSGTAPGAAGDDLWPRPQDTTYEVSGHGYGHGRGMSQYGAQGAAAVRGLSSAQILDFYYPGTTAVNQGNPLLTVRLDTVDTTSGGALRNQTVVVPAAGLTARAGAAATVLPTAGTGGPITSWRTVLVSGALRLQYLTTGWYTYDLMGDGSAPPSPLSLTTSGTPGAGRVTVVLPSGARRTYRGWVQSVRHVPSGSSTPRLRTVNAVPFEDYLKGVVPNESPHSWAPAALQAQAVAARTYAAYKVANGGAAPAQICDTTSCQVYTGTSNEQASTTAAVAATSGSVRHYAGRPALTEFTSSNGGWTEAGGMPYQVAKADPYDGLVAGSTHRWSRVLTASRVERAYPSVGRLLRLKVLSRNGNGEWGGRTLSVQVTGTGGSVTASSTDFRARVNAGQPFASQLISGWFTVGRPDSLPRDADTDGRADVYASTAAGALRVYPGTGSGTFSAARSVGSGWQGMPWVATAGDFDGDQERDLLARTAGGALVLYSGTGAGSLRSGRTIGSGWHVFSEVVVPGDLDGDQLPDVVAYRPATGALLVYRGDGRGRFASAGRQVAALAGYDAFTPVGDFTGDGRVDLLARRRSDGSLWLLAGTGSATTGFAAPRRVGTGWSAFDAFVGAGDVDEDARPDLLVRRASDGSLWLYRSNGTGGWLGGARVGSGWAGLRLVR